MCTKSPEEGVSTISSAVEDVFCERCVLPAITRSQESQEMGAPEPAPKSSARGGGGRSSGWKTSKFFSKTMSSGEILRGLRKLSLASSSGSPEAWEEEAPAKSRSGPLQKRASSGNEEERAAARSPGPFRPLSKAMSLSEPGSASRTSSLGIVCKKEDLKAILGTAPGRRFPLASPRKRRQQAPLRQTKSASFDPPREEREAVRRSGSSEESGPPPPSRRRSPADGDSEEPPQQAQGRVEALNARNSRQGEPLPAAGVSAVKWDECEVVDAVLLGDAIESFLRCSMSGPEKRVSFRRHAEKRAKSDE